jgi:hypothetical protein
MAVRRETVWVTDRRVIFTGLSMMTSRHGQGGVVRRRLRGLDLGRHARGDVELVQVLPAGWDQADPDELPAAVARGLRADDPSAERHHAVGATRPRSSISRAAISRAASADLSQIALVRWRLASGV